MVRTFRQTLLLWLCCSFLLLLSLFSVLPSLGYYLANRHELGVDGNDVAFFGHLVWRERHKGEGSVFPPVVLLERVRREEDLLRDGALCVVISRETERREKERERDEVRQRDKEKGRVLVLAPGACTGRGRFEYSTTHTELSNRCSAVGEQSSEWAQAYRNA